MTTTASGLGFAGGGDGVLRAFDVRNGQHPVAFQTGRPIASGPTIFTVGGKEYVAITVGGTPTSSNGGTRSLLQVFALPGAAPARVSPASSAAGASRPGRRSDAAGAPARAATAAAPRRARIGSTGAPSRSRLWQASSSNPRSFGAHHSRRPPVSARA